ncbi:DEAD/DEAH box helicase [Methylobacterium sp. Leaf91]|uniref:DEAD/DEAH box helicase n=1 Tax=Methylobacterium sp. Leaf91 TaxID=1736247 RepID=UPI0006F24EFA|nr:DEAD/DEAH box helicase [Methylobacterium sp. Leaf91]KQP00289.1 hypothetical protein ASF32_13705 [Methylobacterium sp. Leaf91]
MLPSILARQVRNGVEDQLRATFAPSTHGFHSLIERFVGERESLVKGPWLSLDMPFRRSKLPGEFFPAIPLGFKPYMHQERAFQRLSAEHPLSTLVATGTGSGKTECFLLPILDACRKAKAERGIKAIIVYPMNALASDQARRIARLVARNPALTGLKVGLYADESPKSPTSAMTDHGVIDSRAALVANPPDILLTNYKMLDYMLVRPDERMIWERNSPGTLRYLVVDELHTFDGAQGTDLASLVRRLKARLGMRRGNLCCVGTSATLGGPESLDDLIAYAGEIFDEPFDAASVVLEDRQSVMEYLQPIQVASFDVPSEADACTVTDNIDEITPIELVRRSYRMWFDAVAPADLDDPSGRIALGEMVDGHLFFQNLLKVLNGRPTAYAALRDGMRGNRLYRSFSDIHLNALLDTLTALVAHARRTYPDAVDGHGRPVPLPFFSVRHQLWLRELRRMVATVEPTPMLRHHDDLGIDEQRRTLPVIHCRSCGGAGWATVMPADQRRAICAEPKEVYQAYFGYSDRLRFVFREEPVARTRRKVVGQTLNAWLCTTCLVPHYVEEKPEKGCGSCRADPDALLEVFVHKPGRLTDERFRVDHDCPFCGGPSGMGILGAQSVTLVSGMVGTLFGSEHNDDPKLLTFSDSVQDAAHRAAVLQARNATNVFRSALSRFVCEEIAADLETISDKAPAAMHAALGPKASNEDFVATYLPDDMEWREDYKSLLANDSFATDSRLPGYLKERLQWEIFAELTFRSRLGATMERTGIVAPHVRGEAVERVVSEFGLRMPDELGTITSAIEPEDILHFVTGVLDHMRARGAVATDITKHYVEREASWFAVLKAHPSGRSLPQYAPDAPKPLFPSNRILRGFEPVANDAVGGWYVPWFHKCFDHALTLTGTLYRDAYHLLFKVLEHQKVVERYTVGYGRDPAASAAWGLKPEMVLVHTDTAQVRCDTCGHDHRIPTSDLSLWKGMPCTRIGCAGRQSEVDDTARTAIRTRIMTKGRIKRVHAAEHTSLLGPEERRRVEECFLSETPRRWYPNLLSATPTLEMGINIGDLSTLVLCSVPPEQQNYVQRIGRTGRRDGNSLNLTVANGRPHDMWYWTDPQEMIAGKVKTPGVHLKAVAILRRQFAAYTLDCWVKEEGAGSRGYGKMGAALKAIQTNHTASFPLVWFDYLAREGKAEELFQGFSALFPRIREDSETAETLHAFAVGGATAGLTHLVASEYADVALEIASIWKRMGSCKTLIDKAKNMVPPPLDLVERVKDLTGEREALRRIRQGIETWDNLGFLTDRGVLPNYAFPEQGVTLKSVLYRSEPATDEDRKPTVTEYMRPAAAALSDFAPNAVFYAQGQKLKIDQVDLAASPIEHWRVCPECTHIELDQVGTTEAPCPSCSSSMWADTGSRRPMIRLKQVLAVGSERKSRIGNDSDERDRHYFDRDYLPAFEKDQVGDAYAVDNGDLPFAYEHLRRCTFREVNFGERGDKPSGQKVAGEHRHGHGFNLCRSCGKVQAEDELRRLQRDGSKLGLHVPRCQEIKSESEETYVSVVYLYREFTSEAIRMLLPLASSHDADSVKSLRAAIDLGLRLHFKGKVDHLRSSLVETKEGSLNRRHLYVYDTVPGGTGYLKQLAARPDELRSVFAHSLDHMRDCKCNADPLKDGCPRCIRSHSATFGMGEISRDKAIQIVADILSGWDGLRAITSVNEIKLNKVIESDLEYRFLLRFEKDVKASDGGKFTKMAISGKPGYAVTFQGSDWRLEPQVDLHSHFANVPKTRADFVLWPAVPKEGVRPVAIYADGWQFHAAIVPYDLTLRQKLVRSGHLHVWSVTDSDVEQAAGATGPKHYWDPLANLPYDTLTKMTDGASRVAEVKAVFEEPPFLQFLRLVREAESGPWARRAVAMATAILLKGAAAGRDATKVHDAVEAMAGENGRVVLEDLSSSSLLGIVETPAIGTLAVAVAKTWKPPAWPDMSRGTVSVGFEHRVSVSSHGQKAWNGGLRLLNLLQFLPSIYVGCAEGIALDPLTQPHLPEDAATTAWGEVEGLLPELGALVRSLRSRVPPSPVPEVLYEVSQDDGSVLGTLELAWPAIRRGVVVDPALVGAFPGWTVVVYTGQEDVLSDAMGAAA